VIRHAEARGRDDRDEDLQSRTEKYAKRLVAAADAPCLHRVMNDRFPVVA
jgi:hypothetical protein